MNCHERAAYLVKKAAEMGLDAPTEQMISQAIQDAECDALTIPMTVAVESCRWEDGGTFLRAVRKAVGSLAESAAKDLAHMHKYHSKWYQAVKQVRTYVTLP